MKKPQKRTVTKTKPKGVEKTLHPRNIHNNEYNFTALIKTYPPLAPFVNQNKYGNLSIDFANPNAVKALNAALLKNHYKIIDWDIPEGALCPPIPGRVDYIHYIAELLGVGLPDKNTKVEPITLLDIGTGANGIYPLLACQIYGWKCVGSDINPISLENVSSIISRNPQLQQSFVLRRQEDKNHIFEGIIAKGEIFDVTVCNPPFHSSEKDARKGSLRKLNNLARNRGEKPSSQTAKTSSPTLNFGGLDAELWCKGGERLFLKKLMQESQIFGKQCRWFTSLVSKIDNVAPSKKILKKLGATDIREIQMAQGNKITRILAWTFL